MLRKCICGLAAVLLFAQAGASAEPSTKWAKVGEWDIMVDSTLGNGCFAVGSYTLGEIIRIGIDNRDSKDGYLMLGNDAVWKSIEIGKEYRLQLQFDQETPWFGKFTATPMGTSKTLLTVFRNPNFLRDFGAKQLLTISYNNNVVAKLPLTGTFAAVQSLVACQQANGGEPAAASTPPVQLDPFAKPRPAARPADPFATGGRSNDPFKM